MNFKIKKIIFIFIINLKISKKLKHCCNLLENKKSKFILINQKMSLVKFYLYK